MAYTYQCPVDGCEFSSADNDLRTVIESAQQHHRDAHGDMPTRDEVEASIVGPR